MMKKLSLSLLFSTALMLPSSPIFADTVEGYTALINGDNDYAYHLFLEEAEKDAAAAYVIGMMNYEGIGIPKNRLEAEKWLGFAAMSGNQSAQYNIGLLRNKGIVPINSDDPLGINSLMLASNAGNKDASILLITTLLESEDAAVPSFFTEEMTLQLLQNLERDFKQGEMFAAFALASYWMNAAEYGGVSDARKSLKYLNQAYDQGFKPALIGLVALYREGGENLPIDTDKADHYEALLMANFADVFMFQAPDPQMLTLYDGMTKSEQKAAVKGLEKRAQSGDISAIMDIANRYEKGLGVPQDAQKANDYLTKLLKLGSEGAFLYGKTLLERNDKTGETHIKQAASNNYLPAIQWLIDIGNTYFWDSNEQDIIAYEQQGAKLNDPISINAIIERLITERSELNWWNDDQRPEAVINEDIKHWVTQLLEIAPNDAEAHSLMGDIYQNGIGVTADSQLAYAHYLTALDLDAEYYDVLMKLGRISIDGKGTEIAYENAAQYYLSAWNQRTSIDALDGLISTAILTNQFEALPDLKAQIMGDSFKHLTKEDAVLGGKIEGSGEVLDLLLQELQLQLMTTEYESYYAYLVADHYYEQYLAASKLAHSESDELEKGSDKEALLANALKYYVQGYRYSEQAKLHYAETLFALSESGIDPENAPTQKKQAIGLLMAIDSLITNAALRENALYAAKERNLTEAERVRATTLVLAYIEESPTLQNWVGERVLSENPTVMEKFESLAALSDKDANKAFAQYYLAVDQINKGQIESGYQLLEKAGNNDYLPAILQIAENYLQNNKAQQEVLGGSSMDAITWYEKGAALQDDESIYQLAEIYFDNKLAFDLPPGETDVKALYYYNQLSDPDYRFANFHRPDAIERIEEYQKIQKGVALKDPDAIYQEARIYLYGHYGVKVDEERGNKLLLEAAELGSVPAMRVFLDQDRDNLALKGEDLARLNRYHTAIAESGDAWEMRRLGDRYLQGDRIPMDREKARDLYTRSGDASYDLGYMEQFDVNLPLAEKGNSEAMLKIGRAYEHGNGIQQDHQKGYEWQKKAAEAGNSDAAFYYGVYMQEGVVGRDGEILHEPNWPLALKWYEKVSPRFEGTVKGRMEEYNEIYLPAENGDTDAMLKQAERMASHYEYKKSSYYLDQAKAWAQKSIDAGNINGYITMMNLLSEPEQKDYFTSLLEQAGDLEYQYNIAMIILDKLPDVSAKEINIAIEKLITIVIANDAPQALQQKAMDKLMPLYKNGYDNDKGETIIAPNLADFAQLYQKYGAQSSVLLKAYGAYLLNEDPVAAIALLEAAYQRGETSAAEVLYQYYLPGHYDEITQAKIANIELWGLRFIEASLADKARQDALQSEREFFVYINQSPEYDAAHRIGNLWNDNGIDFVKDPAKAYEWYLRAFAIIPTREVAEKLQKIAESKYQTDPNIEGLEEIYFYGSFAKNIAQLDYPFNQITDEKRAEIYGKVVELEDDREFGAYKEYVNEIKVKSDAGDKAAASHLARIYEDGRQVRRNMDTAIAYYERAGNLGNADAYNRLGNLYRKDADNVTPDYTKAVGYFEKGAALGDSNTAHLAGDMHYFGEGGIPKNYEKAAQYYDMTELKQGNHHALAKYKLAEIYYKGLAQAVTVEDYQKAYQLLILADEYGEGRATKALQEWDFSMLTDAQKADGKSAVKSGQ